MSLRPRWQGWGKTPWALGVGQSQRRESTRTRHLQQQGTWITHLVRGPWLRGIGAVDCVRLPRAARGRSSSPTPMPAPCVSGLRRAPDPSVFRKRTRGWLRLGGQLLQWRARRERGGVKGCGPASRAGVEHHGRSWELCERRRLPPGRGQPGRAAQQPHLLGDQQVHARVGAEGALLALRRDPRHMGSAGQAHQRVQGHCIRQVCPQLAGLQGHGGDARPVPQPQRHQAHQGAGAGSGCPRGRCQAAVGVVHPLVGAHWAAPGIPGSGSGRGGRRCRECSCGPPAGRAALGCGGMGDAERTSAPGSDQASAATPAAELRCLDSPAPPPSLIHRPAPTLTYFEDFSDPPQTSRFTVYKNK